jgi:hypothetical protein
MEMQLNVYGTYSLHNFPSKDFQQIVYNKFETFTAVTMKSTVFWDVIPCGFCKNQRFRGK